MQKLSVDVRVTRGGIAESQHSVHAVAVDDSGYVVAQSHDPSTVTFWRSCAKPFQVMPLLESGNFEALDWTQEFLALACASHGGEPEHVDVARRMLESLALDVNALACGAHSPLTVRGRYVLESTGAMPTRLHNNCSGKHSAMLARAHVEHWASAGYHITGHPVQRACLTAVSIWCGVPEHAVIQALDGCGVVVFGLPLHAMAKAYARLAAAVHARDEIPSRIVAAMQRYPFLIGGTGRFDTALLEATGGRVVAKVGAEGVHSLALLDMKFGLAIKVDDGAERAQYPAVIAALQQLGALPMNLPPVLVPFATSPILNTRGEVVGDVHVVA